VPSPDAGSVTKPDAAGADVPDADPLSGLPCDFESAQIDALMRGQLQWELDALFGRFVNGDVFVYRGHAAAADNASVLPGHQDGELEGSVIAAVYPLQPDGAGPNTEELRVVGTSVASWFWVQTAGDSSGPGWVSAVLPIGASGGSYGTTLEPIPSLASASDPVVFSVHATGTWGDALTPCEVDAYANLERVLPSSVTLEDLRVLEAAEGGQLAEFLPNGVYAERAVKRSVGMTACVPVGSGYLPGACSLQVEFSAIEYVNPNDLADNGARDVEILAAKVCCSHCDEMTDEHCTSGQKSDCYP
jgi:hypothetical protein